MGGAINQCCMKREDKQTSENKPIMIKSNPKSLNVSRDSSKSEIMKSPELRDLKK